MIWVNGQVVLQNSNVDAVNQLVNQLKTDKVLHTTAIDVTGWKQQGTTLTVKWAAEEVPPNLFAELERSGFVVNASWWNQSTKTVGEFSSETLTALAV